jgi:hypothetical protein
VKITWTLLLTFLAFFWTACDRGKEPASPGGGAKAGILETDPVKRQALRLRWHQETLVKAYQTIGRRRASWDAPAEQALGMFAESRSLTRPTTKEFRDQMKQLIGAAVDAGCDDPLIGYLYVRFVVSESSEDPVQIAQKMRSAAEALNGSEYNSLAKFYGCLRAAEASIVEIGADRRVPEPVQRMRYGATTNLLGVLRDRSTPADDVYQATHEWLPTAKRSARQFPEDLRFIEPELKKWGDEPLLLLARAECAIAAGWNARGGGYADSVTPEGWKVFGERLAEAKTLIEKAWKQDATEPRLCDAMLTVAVGLSFKRPEMEKWFERAMKLDTNNYTACLAKLHYLKPQWMGSPEEMLAFGRQCLSKPWGGEVPLTLVEAHRALVALLPEPQRLDYWKDDEVWRDMDKSFNRFFDLNEAAVGYRHDYAWYAFHAGRWQTFQQQLPLFRGTNYAYFGGKPEFDRMVKTASEQAKKP